MVFSPGPQTSCFVNDIFASFFPDLPQEGMDKYGSDRRRDKDRSCHVDLVFILIADN